MSAKLKPDPVKVSKNKITLMVIIALISVFGGLKWTIDQSRGGLKKGVYSRSLGNPKAPLHIVEFADFQCPACAAGAVYLKKFMEDHPDLIRLEMKYYPLAMHRHGILSAWYAECAARQGKFWPFGNLLFERQKEWENMIDAKPAFELMAKDLNMDHEQIQVCLNDDGVNDLFIKEKNEGKILGVSSTPTYFINNKMVVGHKNLSTELEQYLNANQK